MCLYLDNRIGNRLPSQAKGSIRACLDARLEIQPRFTWRRRVLKPFFIHSTSRLYRVVNNTPTHHLFLFTTWPSYLVYTCICVHVCEELSFIHDYLCSRTKVSMIVYNIRKRFHEPWQIRQHEPLTKQRGSPAPNNISTHTCAELANTHQTQTHTHTPLMHIHEYISERHGDGNEV